MASWTHSFAGCLGLLMFCVLICAQLFVTPWTVAYQAPLSMGFSRQERWSGLPCPLWGDLPNPGIKPRSPALQVDSLPTEPPGKPDVLLEGSLVNSFSPLYSILYQNTKTYIFVRLLMGVYQCFYEHRTWAGVWGGYIISYWLSSHVNVHFLPTACKTSVASLPHQ